MWSWVDRWQGVDVGYPQSLACPNFGGKMKLRFVVLIALLLIGCVMHKQVDALFDHWYAVAYHDGFMRFT